MRASVKAYCTDGAVRTAVDHILSSTNKKGSRCLPPDLDWKDLIAFHGAVLSAHQVRCEYAMDLIDLWDAVWRTTLCGCDFGRKLKGWSVDKVQNDRFNLDTYSVWENQWFGRGFDIEDKHFKLAAGVYIYRDTKQLQLSLGVWDQDDTRHTAKIKSLNSWKEQGSDDEEAFSSKDLATIKDDGTIDLTSIHEAVADALSTVNDFFND